MGATNQVVSGAMVKLNRFEEAAFETPIDAEALMDALADIYSAPKMQSILDLVVSGGDDAELGRMIRTEVEKYVLASNRFKRHVSRAEADAREGA